MQGKKKGISSFDLANFAKCCRNVKNVDEDNIKELINCDISQ